MEARLESRISKTFLCLWQKGTSFLNVLVLDNTLESPSSHPLFSTERKFGVVSAATVSELSNLRQKFQSCGLLPGIHIETAHRASWIILNGTKYSKGALIAIGVIGNPPLPEFRQLSQIWLIEGFFYFEALLFATVCFDDMYQAYSLTFVPNVVRVVPYESLEDFNVSTSKLTSLRNVLYLQSITLLTLCMHLNNEIVQ